MTSRFVRRHPAEVLFRHRPELQPDRRPVPDRQGLAWREAARLEAAGIPTIYCNWEEPPT